MRCSTPQSRLAGSTRYAMADVCRPCASIRRAVVCRSTVFTGHHVRLPVGSSVRRKGLQTGRNILARGVAKASTATTTTSQWWKKDEDLWIEVNSEEEFDKIINEGTKLVVVDFYATWCQGCQNAYPELCKVAADPSLTKNFTFVKACVDSMKRLARVQNIKALPHAAVYKPGEGKLVGVDIPPSKVKNFKANLQVILMNPGMAYKCDPNGFVVPYPKENVESEEDKKRKEVEALNQQNQSLFSRLMQMDLNGSSAPSTSQTSSTNGKGSTSDAKHMHMHRSPHKTPAIPRAPALESYEPLQSMDGYDHEMALEKSIFVARQKNEYGYGGLLDTIYPEEVGCRMEATEHYLDYTGAGVYCQTQINNVFDELRTNMFGNPHSMNPSSSFTSEKVEEVRDYVLKYFNADPREYFVVFTRGATGSLKMVGEMFPWSENSKFRYLRENHNSVLGIREYALRNKASFEAVDESYVADWLQTRPTDNSEAGDEVTYNLFAYPGEDNFAGVKYPLSWVEQVRQLSTKDNRWLVCLDAAAYVPTQPLDLKEVPVDFLAMSFYKMFGYPTGLGALIVRIEAAELLRKVFWGGGTVALATSGEDFHVLKCKPTDKLEDGTVAFLDIIALKHGFDMMKRLGGIYKIQAHVACLTEYLYEKMMSLHHSNGQPMVRIFGKHHLPDSRKHQGGIVNFELLKPDGKAFSYKTVEREAADAGIHLRTGAECNPGACYHYLGIKDEEVEQLVGVKEGCEDDVEFIRVERPSSPGTVVSSSHLLTKLNSTAVDLGHPAEVAMKWVEVPLGSIRVSLGYMSRFEDCYKFVNFLRLQYMDRYVV